MSRSRTAVRARRRRKQAGRRRHPSQKSIGGSLLLEILALAAFLMLLSVTKGGGDVVPKGNVASDQPADFSCILAGYLTDQLDRYRPFAGY